MDGFTSSTKENTNRRVLTDVEGNQCAVVMHSVLGGGRNYFKICGLEPLYSDQRKNRDTGLFTYADVKNSSGIGVTGLKIIMQVYGESTETYIATSFGPSIFKWGKGIPRGFLVKNGTTGLECMRITFLGGAKAISVEPDNDFRLMTCFAVIIHEMVEKRMRWTRCWLVNHRILTT